MRSSLVLLQSQVGEAPGSQKPSCPFVLHMAGNDADEGSPSLLGSPESLSVPKIRASGETESLGSAAETPRRNKGKEDEVEELVWYVLFAGAAWMQD